MKIITPSQMQELDRKAQAECKIPSQTLMLNAAKGLKSHLESLIKTKSLNKNIIVFAGKGNNAGDAFCLSGLLDDSYKIKLFMLFPEKELSPDAKHYFINTVKNRKNTEIINVQTKDDLLAQKKNMAKAGIVVDGLLGTGFKGSVSGTLKDAINFINSLGMTTVSIDIPSGLNGEKGTPSPIAVFADYTPTMAFPKTGMFLNAGPNHCAKIDVVDIGFPESILKKAKSNLDLITKKEAAPFFKKRPRVSHKGDFGNILVLAGSVGMTGAGYMAAMAAIRTGSGLVTLGVPESLYPIVASKTVEIMSIPLSETNDASLSPDALPLLKKIIRRFDAVLLGPGLSTNPETIRFVQGFLKIVNRPIVIDADGLNAVSKDLSVLKKVRGKAVLTPHIGEFSRLTGISKERIIKDKFKILPEFARRYGVTVVLKGYNTLVSDGGSIISVNSTGNPGMASAGMGDVLSGIIASFIGQKLSINDAAISGVYIHGLAGDIAAEDTGEAGLIASDVISKIPHAIQNLA